jgi:hypothetical protein
MCVCSCCCAASMNHHLQVVCLRSAGRILALTQALSIEFCSLVSTSLHGGCQARVFDSFSRTSLGMSLFLAAKSSTAGCSSAAGCTANVQALQQEAVTVAHALVDAFPTVHMPLMSQVYPEDWCSIRRCTQQLLTAVQHVNNCTRSALPCALLAGPDEMVYDPAACGCGGRAKGT